MSNQESKKIERKKRMLTSSIVLLITFPIIVLTGMSSVFESQALNYIFMSIAAIAILFTLFELSKFYFKDNKYFRLIYFVQISSISLFLYLTLFILFLLNDKSYNLSNPQILSIFGIVFFLFVVSIITSVLNRISFSKMSQFLFIAILINAYFIALSYSTYILKWNVTIMLILMVVFSDVFAYYGGTKFGKRKLVPDISPNKTTEGYAIGFTASITLGILWFLFLVYYYPDNNGFQNISMFSGIMTIIIVAILAPFGDLFFSWVKREAGEKDYGNTLPGHGGILDRIDSHIFGISIGGGILLAAQLL